MKTRVLQPVCALSLLSAVLVITSGCASPLGRPQFACEGLPSRPLCLSVTEVYQRTEGQGPPPAEMLTRKEGLR
ncbi:MAG: conjugal transfer protein TraV [Lamprobacter sp.]|uniref:conjugal transfer protein TraV n=1 Tax=Lamprobacter sp. TaxID=3100796 RepID=UPI002B25F35B|nr:conjugal transfer protein TraV [Lamprobacter sp.]MEA3642594.1 conjugal transfer protein TraV [Lamprobacter sp.]